MLKKALLYIWQLPQHLLALIVYGVLTVTRMRMKPHSSPLRPEELAVLSIPSFGLSLGEYIFVGYKSLEGQTIQHEKGHSIQSQWLGPLYLLIVGLPSLMRNIYNRIKHKGSVWYYGGFPEKWADRLGGVVRICKQE